MSLEDQFEKAQELVNGLSRTPTQDELLSLYGLYKQAKAGDVSGKRPGMLDLKGRAKYDAWAARRGMSREAAMQGYISLVDQLVS
jgi:diazepam-binding inhibitor (GABA receptor modulator, acyl-CoA-binding protein)